MSWTKEYVWLLTLFAPSCFQKSNGPLAFFWVVKIKYNVNEWKTCEEWRGEETRGGGAIFTYLYQIQIKCQKWNARQRPQTSANLRHMQQQHPPWSTQPNNPTQPKKELQEYNTDGDDDVIALVVIVFSIMVFYHSIHYLLPSKFQLGVVDLGRWGNFVFRLLQCTPHGISDDNSWWHQQHYVILPKAVTFWETYLYINKSKRQAGRQRLASHQKLKQTN